MKALKKSLAIALSVIMALSLCAVAFADPVFNQLPTADSADLNVGDWYFDLSAFMADQIAAGQPQQMVNSTYGEGTYYLSDDGNTLRFVLPEVSYDLDLTDPQNADTMNYLKQHAAPDEPAEPVFNALPTTLSELEIGDLWFDEARYEFDLDTGIYNYNYYLSEDGNTLKIVTDNYIGEHYDETAGVYVTDYETFVYTRAEDPDMFVYVREFKAFGEPLPTKDDENMAPGAYWFDLDGLMAFYDKYADCVIGDYTSKYDRAVAELEQAQAAYDAYVAANPDDEEGIAELQADVDSLTAAVEERENEVAGITMEVEAMLPAIAAGTFCLSTDEYVLRAAYTVNYTLDGQPQSDDEEDFDTQYKGNMLWYYLRQHGVVPNEGFTLMPFEDSDDLEDGDYWFDIEGFIAYLFPGGTEEGEEGYYRPADYYISDDGNTIRFVMFGDVEDITADKEYSGYYFLFLHQHGEEDVDLEGYVAVETDKTKVTAGCWYLDIEQMLGLSDPEPAQILENQRRLTEFRKNHTYYYNETADKLIMLVGATYITTENDVIGYVLSAPDHLYKVSLTGDAAATCTEGGYTGDLVIKKGDDNVVLVAGEEIDPLGHDYVSTVTPPTCTERGYTTYACSRCPDTYVDDYVDANGHAYGAPVWSWTDDFKASVSFTCAQNDDTQAPAVTVTGEITTPATATAAGTRTYTATVVFNNVTYTDTKTEVIPATGEPEQPTEQPTEPSAPSGGDNLCPWDQVDHGTSFWGRIVRFFHNIFYFFAHLFGLR